MKLYREEGASPCSQGGLVVDGESTHVQCPVTSHFPGAPQAPGSVFDHLERA